MPQKHSLDEIKAEIKRLADMIGTPDSLLPTYGYSIDGAHPHIEIDSRGYHYVNVERGQEASRVTTTELDELLYHVFKHITFSLAREYELKHRVDDRDFRRVLFRQQTELLSKLSQRWSEIESRRHDRILEQYPYDDDAIVRMNFSKTLREQGVSPEVAWRRACERYPLPEK